MQLNITTDYAIRIIMHLAETKCVTPASEISETMGIAKKSLLATANKLKAAKLIAGHKGVAGGYSLMRRPEDITLLDIITTMEGKTKINRCLEHDKFCSRFAAETCPVHTFYCEVQDKLERYFTDMTIQKLLEDAARKDTRQGK